MNEKRLQRNEDECIHFLIDMDSVSQKKRNQIEAECSNEIRDFQDLTGKRPALSDSHWLRIRAAFWQQADEKKTPPRRMVVSLAGAMVAMLFFSIILNLNHDLPSVSPHISELITIVQNNPAQEPFESFVDQITPVDPIPDSIWFSNHAGTDHADDLLEELLLVTSNSMGDFS